MRRDRRRPFVRIGNLLCLSVVLAVAAVGCGGGDQSSLDPASPASSKIATLWWVMFAGGVVVTAVVLVLVFVAVLRRRDEATGRFAPGTRFVAVAGVGIPLVVLVALFALTLSTIPETAPASSSTGRAPGLTIDVTGRQWFWDVEYRDSGVRTANEIHIPVGQTVELRVHAADVIHSLWVPRLNRKIDMIPGHTNTLDLHADEPGTFRGQCAEFCGIQHAHMAFWVVAEPPAAFRSWLHAEAAAARDPQTPSEIEGQQVLLGSACVYCHRIAGTNASGEVGPDLTHLASRRALAAATIPNTRGYLAGWVLDPQHVKPGNKMPATDLDGKQLQALLDYLESLR
jgi:cytochrome c oxidase subunit II